MRRAISDSNASSRAIVARKRWWCCERAHPPAGALIGQRVGSDCRRNLPEAAAPDHPDSPFADQPKRLRQAVCSKRSAAMATASAGLVIQVAISRARFMYCGARMRRRSATSECRVVLEKRLEQLTFSRLT